MRYTTTMTSKGQVTVPVAIRRKLGLKPGQAVKFEVADDTVTIQASNWQKGLAELRQEVATHMKRHSIKPLSNKELDKAIDDAAESEAAGRYRRSLQ